MFERLSDKLQGFFSTIATRGRLTEKNIHDGLLEVRTALLEADVNIKVVRTFIENVTAKAVGDSVIKAVSPSDQVVKIVNDELVALMGEPSTGIRFASTPPTVILMAGLQGSGKTTTCAKLARYLDVKENKRCLLVAADVQRPAAIEQLRVVGKSVGAEVYAEEGVQDPPGICKRGVAEAKRLGLDVVILDTAGRLHVDAALMKELRNVARQTNPDQIYLVCDAMTGQDAVNSAKQFNTDLEIDGVILTKMDGDARGGAALSIRQVTGKPIKFIGMGEKLDKLDVFEPERMAGRILGMGDVVGLVERAQEVMDEDEALRLQEKMLKNAFTFEDFRSQLRQVKKMGNLKDILGMLPGVGGQIKDMDIDDRELDKVEAMINSMTPEERRRPEIIGGSRRTRIAKGSGTSLHDVSMLLKQFKDMKKMMKNFSKMGALMGKFPGFGGGDDEMDLGDLTSLMGGAPPQTRKQTRPRRGRRY
ncbi:signal recognition particle protein [Acidimicrobium ferrooxidans]|nr:signal recognition particle protein [Acidimicrobium ferrooxidans]